MITLNSTHILNEEGYAQKTIFTFTVNLKTNEKLTRIEWVWGDGTKNTSNTLTVQKKYDKPGIYGVSGVVYYTSGGVNKTSVYKQKITIKEYPKEKFSLTSTTSVQKPIIYTRATKITLKPSEELFGLNAIGLKYVQWDLGNGIISNLNQLTDITFGSAGMFKIKMLAYNTKNEKVEDEKIITVEEYINDSIKFAKVPPPTYAGHLNRYPFTVEITSTVESEPHYVDLYAQFSRSNAPLVNPTKYSFLRSQWRFLDRSLKQINFVKTIDSVIKINAYGYEVSSDKIEKINENGEVYYDYSDEYKTSVVVGVRGYAEFYFVDDWYNCDQVLKGEQYTTLWATLRSNGVRVNQESNNVDGLHPGHSNNMAQAWCPYVTLWRKPDSLIFTSNGVNSIPAMQWSGSNIPFILKIGYNSPLVYDVHNAEGRITLADRQGGFAHYVPNNNKEDLHLNLAFTNINTPISSFLSPRMSSYYIKYEDDNGLKVGGYYKAVLERKIPGTVSVSASLTAIEPELYGNSYNPLIWLPNPTNATLSVAQYIKTDNILINTPQFYYSQSVDSYNDFYKQKKQSVSKVDANPNLNTALFHSTLMPTKSANHVSSLYDNRKRLSGLYPVVSLGLPTHHAWVADVELDYIYRVTPNGSIYKTLDLKYLTITSTLKTNTTKLTPHTLVVDGNQNLFVGLWNKGCILKFNEEGILIGQYSLGAARPVCVEVDKLNNVYVSVVYTSGAVKGAILVLSNDLSSLLNTKTYQSKEPGDILITKNNELIVVVGGMWRGDGSLNSSGLSTLEKINLNNFPTTSFLYDKPPLPNIRDLTTDRNNNIYFTYGYNMVGRFEENGIFTSLEIPTDQTNDNNNKFVLNGIFYNLNEKIYVVNSIDNKVIVLKTGILSKKSIESSFYINPSKIEYKLQEQNNDYGEKDLLKENEKFVPQKSLYLSSLKARGDATGWKWSSKFNYSLGSNFYTLSGDSRNIWLASHNSYKFYAKNENFDIGKTMYDFSFMQGLQDSPFLYNNKFYDAERAKELIANINEERRLILTEVQKVGEDLELLQELNNKLTAIDENLQEIYRTRNRQKGFIGSIFGSYPFSPEDPGLQTYSKIANFVQNSSDPDTCDLKHLYNIMHQIDFRDEGAILKFPAGLSRIVDYCSINPSKLMGVVCKCGDVFDRGEYSVAACGYCGREKLSNRGPRIDYTINHHVTAGDAYVLSIKGLNKYRKINTGYLNNSAIYTLNDLATSIGLPVVWWANYDFYNYIPNEISVSTLSSLFYINSSFYTLSTTLPTVWMTEFNVNWSAKKIMTPPLVTVSGMLSTISYYTSSLNTTPYFNSTYSLDSYVQQFSSNIFTEYFYSSAIKIRQDFSRDKRKRTENIIDWDNSQTTLPRGTTNSQWYNVNGIIERAINFELQKGLGLI
jgi:hypothetical protein